MNRFKLALKTTKSQLRGTNLICFLTFIISFTPTQISYAQGDKTIDKEYSCNQNDWTEKRYHELKLNNFEINDQHEKQNVAINLSYCLNNPDPDIRDGIAYQAISKWARDDQLSVHSLNTLFDRLLKILSAPNKDPLNFEQPFAALVLAEVVRVDRIKPYLKAEQRQNVVETTYNYMSNIDDYRGFNNEDGWRHAVAHTADLVLQLSLNDQLNKQQLDLLAETLKSQVIAHKNHSYTFGEPRRLAIATVYLFLNDEFTKSEWREWLQPFSEPTPLKNWQEAFKTEAGLAKLHNTRAFLQALYALVGESKNEQLIMMKNDIVNALKQLP